MNSILPDDSLPGADLFPFTLMRPVEEIRIGILTIREKWKLLTGEDSILPSPVNDRSAFPPNLLPSPSLIEQWKSDNKSSAKPAADFTGRSLQYPWQIAQWNATEIATDYSLLTKGRKSQILSATNNLIAPENIFAEEGAVAEYAIINASAGPVYLGKNTEIMEGAMIRGPFALCEGGVVKMGAKIYGGTTIGKYSVAGGEIKNSVLQDYSNKAHDGYLGDAVIGQWCNLGAGSSCSNIKNTGGAVKVWNPASDSFLQAGIKCGLILGDYSRCAINTSFNTGTVTGICCNIFGAGLTPKFIPSFSWGMDNSSRYSLEKAIADIDTWKRFKQQQISDEEIRRLKHIFEQQ